jgi:hypothetical protein
MKKLLRRLLNRLGRIGEKYEEVYDTEVREAMGNAVFAGFIRARRNYALPDDFAMFQPEGNKAVKEALGEYIAAANARAAELGLTSFHDRLAAFQDGEVESTDGNFFDDFFGWADPDQYDDKGNVTG